MTIIEIKPHRWGWKAAWGKIKQGNVGNRLYTNFGTASRFGSLLLLNWRREGLKAQYRVTSLLPNHPFDFRPGVYWNNEWFLTKDDTHETTYLDSLRSGSALLAVGGRGQLADYRQPQWFPAGERIAQHLRSRGK
jgi:hypothetical protein